MTALHRRLERLERSVPRPDPWAGMDEVVAGLTTHELSVLIDRSKRIKNGQSTTREQDDVQATVEDRLRAAGISW